MKKTAEASTRKSISLPDSVWEDVATYRFSHRIQSEAETLRLLIHAGLKAEGMKNEEG